MGLWYLSYLHSNIWLKPIINWVFKKCNPVKSQTQILSFERYTKCPLSNQTKAIVPKAVIWSSVWSEFASLWKLRIRMNLIFIQRGKKMLAGTSKEWQPEQLKRSAETRHREGFMLRTIIPFLSKRFGAFPYSLHLISKLLSGWKEWSQKTFRNGEQWAMYWSKKKAERFTFLQI